MELKTFMGNNMMHFDCFVIDSIQMLLTQLLQFENKHQNVYLL